MQIEQNPTFTINTKTKAINSLENIKTIRIQISHTRDKIT